MPMDIDQDGKKLTVYTKEELDNAVAGAKTGLLTAEEAERMANTRAAAARKETQTDIDKLKEQLAKAGTPEQIAEINQKLVDAEAAKGAADQRLLNIKSLVKTGLTMEQADFLIQHPTFKDAKYDDEGIKATLESAKAIGITPAAAASGASSGAGGGQQQRFGGNGGGNGGGGEAKPTTLNEAIAAHYTSK